MTRPRSGREDGGALDPVQLGKVACQVRVPLGLDAALAGAAAAGGAFAIPRIQPVHDVHAKDDAAERGEPRSEEHTSELQSQSNLVCRLLLEKKKKRTTTTPVHTNTLNA